MNVKRTVLPLLFLGALPAAKPVVADPIVGHEILTVPQWETRHGGPLMVSLPKRTWTQRDLDEALQQQTGRSGPFVSPAEGAPGPSATFGVPAMPFWKAVAAIGQASHNSLFCFDIPPLDTAPWWVALPEPGSFKLAPSLIQRYATRRRVYHEGGAPRTDQDSQITLYLALLADPRAVLYGTDVRVTVESAVDASGRSLGTSQRTTRIFPSGAIGSARAHEGEWQRPTDALVWQVPVPLEGTTAPRLTRLSGYVDVPVISATRKWRAVLRVAEPQSERATMGNAEYCLSAVRTPIGNGRAETPNGVRLSYVGPCSATRLDASFPPVFAHVAIIGADGKRTAVTARELTSRIETDKDGARQVSASFPLPAVPAKNEAVTVEWDAPTRWDVVRVPFELANVAIPTFDIPFPDRVPDRSRPADTPRNSHAARSGGKK